ncbi:MAG: NUDIX hydrolase [Promethearchaeota archaeon]
MSVHKSKEFALPIAIGIIIDPKTQQILLIERVRGAYVGLLGLPGGKIEKYEFVHDAIIRELYEETGLNTSFIKLMGIVSELVETKEEHKIIDHFLLHVCLLSLKKGQTNSNPLDPTDKVDKSELPTGNKGEGKFSWFRIDNLINIKDKIIPSDFKIIQEFVIKSQDEFKYFKSKMIKDGENYVLKEFDNIF